MEEAPRRINPYTPAPDYEEQERRAKSKKLMLAVVIGVIVVAAFLYLNPLKKAEPAQEFIDKASATLAAAGVSRGGQAAPFILEFDEYDYATESGETLELQHVLKNLEEDKRSDSIKITNTGEEPVTIYVVEVIPPELQENLKELDFASAASQTTPVALPIVIVRSVTIEPGQTVEVGVESQGAQTKENVGAIFAVAQNKRSADALRQLFEQKITGGKTSQKGVLKMSFDDARELSQRINNIMSDAGIADKTKAVSDLIAEFEARGAIERSLTNEGEKALFASGTASVFAPASFLQIPFFKDESLGELLFKTGSVTGELAPYLADGYPKEGILDGQQAIDVLFDFRKKPGLQTKNEVFWNSKTNAPLVALNGELKVWFAKVPDKPVSIPLKVRFTQEKTGDYAFASPNRVIIVVDEENPSKFVSKPVDVVNNLPIEITASACGKQAVVPPNSVAETAFYASPTKACSNDETKNWLAVEKQGLDEYLWMAGNDLTPETYRADYYCEEYVEGKYCVEEPDFLKGVLEEDAVAPAFHANPFANAEQKSDVANWLTCSNYYCECWEQKYALADFETLFKKRVRELNSLEWSNEALEKVFGREFSQTMIVRTSPQLCTYADFPTPFNSLSLEKGSVYAIKLIAPLASETRGFDARNSRVEAAAIIPQWSYVTKTGLAQSEEKFSVYAETTSD